MQHIPQGLKRKLNFLKLADKLKHIDRKTWLISKNRVENTAEHSWHVALCALVLAEECDEKVDISKVIKMLLIHDLIEIESGDTFAYDVEGRKNQKHREKIAANKIFGQLPDKLQAEFMNLWEEFESETSPESRFSKSLDRFLPLLQNYGSDGKTWKKNNINSTQVRKRNNHIKKSSTSLHKATLAIIDESIKKNLLEDI